MLPLIQPGDAVTIHFCQAGLLSAGDVVAYEADNLIAVHRVLRKTRKKSAVEIYQKGDNQKSGYWVDRSLHSGKNRRGEAS